MESNFEERAHDAACMIMGEAIWQIIATREKVSQEAIARMVVELSEHQPDIAVSIALSVLKEKIK